MAIQHTSAPQVTEDMYHYKPSDFSSGCVDLVITLEDSEMGEQLIRACNAHGGLVDFLKRLEIASGFTNTFKRQTEMAIVLRDLSGVLVKAAAE